MTTVKEMELPKNKTARSGIIKVIFWICTGLIALQSLAGAILDLSGNPDFTGAVTNLGYPAYLLYILGFWRVLAFFAILLPRFPRIKEWAYAGLFFDFTGAVASHIFTGDGFDKWASPLAFSLILLVSWALRPGDRKLPAATRVEAIK